MLSQSFLANPSNELARSALQVYFDAIDAAKKDPCASGNEWFVFGSNYESPTSCAALSGTVEPINKWFGDVMQERVALFDGRGIGLRSAQELFGSYRDKSVSATKWRKTSESLLFRYLKRVGYFGAIGQDFFIK
jgi:hypothetical protein